MISIVNLCNYFLSSLNLLLLPFWRTSQSETPIVSPFAIFFNLGLISLKVNWVILENSGKIEISLILTLSFSEFIIEYTSHWCFGFDFEEEWETEFIGWVRSEQWVEEGVNGKKKWSEGGGGFILSNSGKWSAKENCFPFYQTAENVSGKSFFLGKFFSWKMIFPPTKHTLRSTNISPAQRFPIPLE